mmetsp:Transcript_1203/g.2018  ORF Transcript_1203/g.2018 Transcript_1203/m.2018 type:complete len:205 (+) Transcript_1203:355-969(+)
MPTMNSGATSSTEPVIIVAAGESKCNTLAAVSIGLSRRPTGAEASASSSQFSPFSARWPASSASVKHQPMLIAFTRMPLARSSAALFLVSAISPALETEYANMKGAPPCAAIDAMLTMDPLTWCSFMCLVTACVRRNGAVRLVRSIVSHASRDVSAREPRGKQTAAELTRPSTVPNALIAVAMITSHPAGSATSAQQKMALQPL